MKKVETVEVKFIKFNTAVIMALVCLLVGFIGGNIYSVYKASPAQASSQAYVPTPDSSQGPGVDANRTQQILALEKQAENNPNNAAVWVQLGNLYYDSGLNQKAIRAYNKYLVLNPNNPDVWTDLGVMYRRNKQPQDAVAAFEKAMTIKPDHEQAHFNKGVVLMNDLNDREGAVKIWTALLKLNPTFRTPSGVPLINYISEF